MKHTKHKFKSVRERKTWWEKASRDRGRLIKLRDIYFKQISPLLKNIK